MNRRSFLKALATGTAAAFVGAAPRALSGAVDYDILVYGTLGGPLTYIYDRGRMVALSMSGSFPPEHARCRCVLEVTNEPA